jgi:acetyl esterase/lipase
MRKTLLACILVFTTLASNSQQTDGFAEYTYKQKDTVVLKLHILSAADKPGEKYHPAIIFFFGGGWNSGSITQFRPHAEYFASRGMVTVLAEYRVKSRHNTTPFEAVSDAKSAVRYLRKNFETLHIDTSAIVASGGSAGGHLAAAAAAVTGLDDPEDDLRINARPAALILFNPVFDNGPEGYGYERVGERYREISPMHNIRKGSPPSIVFLGTADRLIPVETARLYKQKIEEAGSRCDLFLYDSQPHGFFNYRKNGDLINPYFIKTVYQADLFLKSLGYLKGDPTIDEFQKNLRY